VSNEPIFVIGETGDVKLYLREGSNPDAAYIDFQNNAGTDWQTRIGKSSIHDSFFANNVDDKNIYFQTSHSTTGVRTTLQLWNSGSAGLYTRVRMADTYNATTGSAANVNINSSGDLNRSTSSLRFKTDIEPIAQDRLDAIFDLQPIWFRSLAGGDLPGSSFYGFGAEDVAEVDPRLVFWGKADDCDCDVDERSLHPDLEHTCRRPEGVMYDRMVPHLVGIVKQQRDRIGALEDRLTALEERFL
jgi:hypothetical protein